MGNQGGHQYTISTYWVHRVSEYTGLNFNEVWALNYIVFLTLRRDAFIAWLSRTETGTEYLDNAWRMEQTEPDRKALRAKFGRKEARMNGEEK
jgi:hypothetical protein